jgi:hypothetical protein
MSDYGFDDQEVDESLVEIGVAISDDAKEKLRGIAGVVGRVGEAIAGESDPAKVKQLRDMLDDAKRLVKDHQIESNLATLTDRQLEAVGAWESGRFKTVACCGTNRSGKSFVGGTAYAKYLRDDAPKDSEHLLVTSDQRLSAKNQQKIISQNLPHHRLDCEWKGPKNGFGSRNPVVVIDPGTRNVVCHFMTEQEYINNSDCFEGLSATTAWIDEKVSHALFGAIKARLTLSDDGRLLVSSIPRADWYWTSIHNAPPESRVWYKMFTPGDNPLMTPEKWDEFCRSVPSHERDVRLKGVPALAGSLVYPEFRDDIHVIEPHEVPKDLCWYAGLDVGADHPTVWLLVGACKDGKVWVVDEYVSRHKTPAQDAEVILAKLNGRPMTRGYHYIDPAAFAITKANNVSVAQQYKLAGIATLPSRRTSEVGEHAQVAAIKDMLVCEELFVSKNCPQLIREFHVWSYKRRNDNQIMESDTFVDKDNDALDALRYCLTMKPVYTKQSVSKPKVIYT